MAANVVNGPYDTLGMPPDSTGKLMGVIRNVVIEYTGTGDPAKIFAENDEIIGLTSGFNGFVTAAGGNEAAGQISVLARINSPVTLPTVGESLLVDGVVYGTVADLESVYTPGSIIASGDNPAHTARVDSVGNLYARFAEGEPQTSPFGMLRTSEPTTLAAYTFRYGINDEEWEVETSGTGSGVSELTTRSSLAIECDINSGDLARITTHEYHLYQPAYGSQLGMTIVLGDTGEAGNKRRWGLYDDDDGLFFELDGTTLYVVIRTNVTGSPVETRIAQSNWNRDRVDGTSGLNNPSQHTLNIQNVNIYWIDFQWLGAGRVRFGIYLPNGSRAILHEEKFAGTKNVPYMAKGSLPIRVESVNTGTTASPKRINFTCAYVSTEGPLFSERNTQFIRWTEEALGVSFGSAEIPVMSFRSKTEFGPVGQLQTNRKASVPEKLSIYVTDNPVILRLRRNLELDGANFVDVNNPNAVGQVDTLGTISATGEPGRLIASYFLEPGSHDIVLPKTFSLLGESMRLTSTGLQTDIFSWTVEELNAGMSGTVSVAATWLDVGGA